jgi:hypothetical protein
MEELTSPQFAKAVTKAGGIVVRDATPDASAADVEKIFTAGGAQETFLEAKEEGTVSEQDVHPFISSETQAGPSLPC